MLPFTKYSWTNTKYSFQELFFHHCKSFRGKYESGVNQAINIGSLLIDSEISLILKLLIFWWFRSENHLKRLIVMIKHLFNTIKIEIITNVLFINFTEKLMIFQVTKPINPSNTLLRTVWLWIWHISVTTLNLFIYQKNLIKSILYKIKNIWCFSIYLILWVYFFIKDKLAFIKK